MTLNVRINDADAEILRIHLRDSHPSLFDPVVDGPLPEDLDVSAEILCAVHTANHMIPWREHRSDEWIRSQVHAPRDWIVHFEIRSSIDDRFVRTGQVYVDDTDRSDLEDRAIEIVHAIVPQADPRIAYVTITSYEEAIE